MQVQSAVTKYCFNPFDAIVSFYPPLKIFKKRRFSISKGYRKRQVLSNGSNLMNLDIGNVG